MDSSPPVQNMTGQNDVPIVELVFSCSICQATLSEIAARSDGANRNGNAQEDISMAPAKLWIAECSHITCIEHLEGGSE